MFGGWYYTAFRDCKDNVKVLSLICGPFKTWQEVDAIKAQAHKAMLSYELTGHTPDTLYGPVYVVLPSFVPGLVNGKVWANYHTERVELNG